MSASSPIDLTISPLPVRRTPTDIIIINSESEDEINDSSHNRNNNSSGSNTSYNLRSGLGLGTNGSSSNRSTSTRSNRTQSRQSALSSSLSLLNLVFTVNNNRSRHHSSAFHPYASTLNDLHYGNNNSSGSSRSPFFDSVRTNTNINSNDIQILNTSPRRRTINSPKPPILSGHARDLDDSHTLICAECDELLHEKLWALSNCGHVVCGSCVDKYKYSEKKKFPCPSCKKTVNPKNILPLYV
ncbi:SUMO-targeted ubiquitin-protein ligase subunit Rfp1 [Rhizophagus clarus]|uniref:SUMO-targeted ubiquitin-protein ligase subunit Rfp1 n=1 Tax=Rhizophagus clarus TaxID=94130 RepID=A0A8H3MAY3_9GLOM|nr:SUMO-targeted ubiquitin-protein ligase subunit Rfp1 [Rhizophagus clarus]